MLSALHGMFIALMKLCQPTHDIFNIKTAKNAGTWGRYAQGITCYWVAIGTKKILGEKKIIVEGVVRYYSIYMDNQKSKKRGKKQDMIEERSKWEKRKEEKKEKRREREDMNLGERHIIWYIRRMVNKDGAFISWPSRPE